MRANQRGLTLTELLIAMAIFALGGASIVALFLANAKLSAQAVNMTRAAEITRNVRAYITSSLQRPIVLPNGETIYRFDYAGASLSFLPSKMFERENSGIKGPLTQDDFVAIAGKSANNTVYFKLPAEKFNATVKEAERDELMVDLPDEGLGLDGNPLYSERAPEVFRLLPDTMRENAILRGFDPDDRMFYSFDFSVRRSVSRSSDLKANTSGERENLEDLFVVHLRVYRGFDFAEENANVPLDNERNIIFETSFFVTAAR